MPQNNKDQDRHKVRVATSVDIEKIVRFLCEDQLDEQNNLDWFMPRDYETVKTTFFNMIVMEEGVVWLSTFTTKDGKEIISGILALRLEQTWWSTQRMLVNIVFYVNPQFRSYNLANRLLNVGISFAKASGFELVASTFQYTNQVDKLERYFKLKKFDKIGSVLVYRGE